MLLNYKKNLLSIAAIAALGVTSLSANYIPLVDSAGHDKSWVLFGVTGLKATGAGTGRSAGTFSISDNVANKAKDETQDDLYTEGLQASTGESLGKVKVLAPYANVEIRIDTSGAVFNATEPVRTMYVAMEAGSGPAFAVVYRASLEGHEMQYSINSDGSDAHTIILNSANTYNNPGLGAVIQDVPGMDGSALSKLSDIVDYDFTNNPVNFEYYAKDTDQNEAGGDDYLRVYSYDTTSGTWALYDSRNSADANDFIELTKGKAYWAKMHSTAGHVAGLVLGSSSISPAEYTAAGITDGWNLTAFDAENPYIRKSETGLILTLGGDDVITIYDVSGNHSVNVTIADHTNLPQTSRAINEAIKESKVNGTFPKTFDLRAYPLASNLALIATARFIVADTNNAAVTNVTTLAGKNPYKVKVTDLETTDDSTATSDLGDGTDIASSPAAMSKYGEYALLIEPLVGSGTASANHASIHVQSAADDATANPADATDSDANMADVVTSLGNGGNIGGATHTATYNEVDTTLDGTTDKVLIAATEPFYVRDHTFTRTFAYTDVVGSATAAIFFVGTGHDGKVLDSDLEGDGDDNAHDFVAAVNNHLPAGLTDFSANQIGSSENVAFITTLKDANEFQVLENTSPTEDYDTLTDIVSNDKLAKGAVKGVYSLGNLASVGLLNTVASLEATNAGDGLSNTTHADTKISIAATTLYGSVPASTAKEVGADAVVSVTTYADYLKSEIEAYLKANSISYESVTVTATDPHDITVVSSEIKRLIVDQTVNDADTLDTNDDASDDTFGQPVTLSADLAADLKYNAIYTPNYVVDGPLYTMKEAGFDLKALVTGTTDLSDGSIIWDSIDLTRTPSSWLDSQDYNLFEIDETSGYWAYLAADTTANPIVVSKAEIKPIAYTYHFNKVSSITKSATNYNHVSGNIALTVDGLETDARAVPIVSATVAGSVIELSNVAGSNAYTGKLSSYEIESLNSGYNYEIFANIADGLGNHVKSLDLALKIDYLKPTLPNINLGDGTNVVFTSSADVAGYYIFNGQIPEIDTAEASNLLASITSTEAAGYALCSADKINALAWDEKPYDLNVIAVDGTGVLEKGNVSDTNTKKYVPMLKNAVRLVDTANSDSDATTLGNVYNVGCGLVGPQSENYGVTLTAETDLHTVKIAYTPENVSDTTATPITLFVNTSEYADAGVAKITYADVYAGKKIYVDLSGHVYSLLLPTESEIENDDNSGDGPHYGDAGVGASSDNPLDLKDGIDDTQAGDNHGYAEMQEDQSL